MSTLVTTYTTTRYHNPDDHSPDFRNKNLTSHIMFNRTTENISRNYSPPNIIMNHVYVRQCHSQIADNDI
jgi:hypothetical protein